jgi:DNA-binding NarL/FixJ family response regulator
MKVGHSIRVVLADDHTLVRHGIRAMLEKTDDIQVVGEASDGQEALELVHQSAPDVLLADIAMPRMDGLEAIQQVRALDGTTRVIVLSMYSDPSLVRKALQEGAAGYLLKSSVPAELLLAVRAVSRGEVYLSPPVAQPIVRRYLASEDEANAAGSAEGLTPREREVLQLVVQGETNTAIAAKLGVSVKTIEKHRSNLMAKLRVHNLAELISAAARLDLLGFEG